MMNFSKICPFFACFLVIAGCASSSRQAAVSSRDTSNAISKEPVEPMIGDTVGDSTSRSLQMKAWQQKFIPTGLASGIMIEFTGVKKDKPLHARYAGIELRRYPSSPLNETPSGKQLASIHQEARSTAEPFDVLRLEPFSLSATINDVKQAFFKVPPGKYILRQTKEWADQGFFGDVIVREGNYSVVIIPVHIPGSSQP